MVPAVFEHSLVAHTAQLLGERAAVEVEVVGQLLAVEGNGKFRAALAGGLKGQVGEQAAPDGLGGGVKNPPGQGQIFPGRDGQQVADQAAVVAAGAAAGGQQPLSV